MGFEEGTIDEREYVRMVADRYGTDHYEMVVTLDVEDLVPKLVWHYGEPFADPVTIPTYYLSQMTREHVTVALNGDGGDENFMGYRRYAGVRVGSSIDILPLWLRKQLSWAAGGLPTSSSNRGIRNLRQFLIAADRSNAERYGQWVSYFSDELKDQLYGEAMREWLPYRPIEFFSQWFSEGSSAEDSASLADMHTFLRTTCSFESTPPPWRMDLKDVRRSWTMSSCPSQRPSHPPRRCRD